MKPNEAAAHLSEGARGDLTAPELERVMRWLSAQGDLQHGGNCLVCKGYYKHEPDCVKVLAARVIAALSQPPGSPAATPADDICWCRKNPCVCLKHDSECEAELTSHGHTPCRCAERAAASPRVPAAATPAPPDDLGLSIDMLDADRLRLWADRISEYGRDITQWGSPAFVVEQLRRIATGIEQAVRDIGVLRAVPAAERPASSDYQALYHELLFAVGNKYPNESRHETALRYIRRAEEGSNEAKSSAPRPPLGRCDENMYGCSPCPKCSSQYRWATQQKTIQCDDCGFVEDRSAAKERE